jgi:hypothetical protein
MGASGPSEGVRLESEPPDRSDHVRFTLIPTAWLAVVTLFAAVCRAAARGNRVSACGRAEQPREAIDGLASGVGHTESLDLEAWTMAPSPPTAIQGSAQVEAGPRRAR